MNTNTEAPKAGAKNNTRPTIPVTPKTVLPPKTEVKEEAKIKEKQKQDVAPVATVELALKKQARLTGLGGELGVINTHLEKVNNIPENQFGKNGVYVTIHNTEGGQYNIVNAELLEAVKTSMLKVLSNHKQKIEAEIIAAY